MISKWIKSLYKRLGGNMNEIDGKHPILIFELGDFQVCSLQTQEEIDTGAPYQLIYWRQKYTGHAHGPFSSIYECMSHYTWARSTQDNKDDTTLAPVIYYDFIKRQRINLK